MGLGKRIQYFRKQAGLTQKQLAEYLQIAPGTMQQYELEKREPKSERVQQIASRLGISVNDLYGIEEDKSDSDFKKACEWLTDAKVNIDAPNENDALQQYYLYSEDEGNLTISCKLDKIDIIRLVESCLNEADEIRDDIAIKLIQRALRSE